MYDPISIDVSTKAAKTELNGRPFIKITVGAVDVQVLLSKSTVAIEDSKYMTLSATQTYYLKSNKGGFSYLLSKTANGTSTLTIIASDDEIYQFVVATA